MRLRSPQKCIQKYNILRFVFGAVFLAVFVFPPLSSYAQSNVLTFYVDDLIRVENDHRVYILTKGGVQGKRRWIRNIEVFNSYNFKWEDVRVVPPIVLTVFEFTNLLRQQQDEKVYLINETGFKRHISSPQVFSSYGFKWSDVAVVPSIEIQSYPESRLIREEGDTKVYLIENNTKRWIESAEVFNSQGFNWNEIQVVNNTDIDFFTPGEAITLTTPEVSPAPKPVESQEEPKETTQEETAESAAEPVSATTTEPTSATTTEPIATVPLSDTETSDSSSGGGGGSSSATDTAAPSSITGLSASSPTPSSITLTWTSPGDDASTGTATSYDIRYSTSNITDSNWTSSTQASAEPTPQAAGSSETMTVSGLSGATTYYFAMKTMDEAGNESGISNITSVATPPTPDTSAPSVIISLSSSVQTTLSVTLSWTAPGDDGNTGTATSYDVRYSTLNITDVNWTSSTQVTGEPAPQAANTTQSMTITGLSAGTTYYFAVKTTDEAGNESGLSNIVNKATVACGTVAPGAQTYNVSSGAGQPQIQGATLNPLDIQSGTSQTITVTARDTNNNSITSMTATITTNSGATTIALSQSSGSATSGSWEGSWTATAAPCTIYEIRVTATSASGTSNLILAFL